MQKGIVWVMGEGIMMLSFQIIKVSSQFGLGFSCQYSKHALPVESHDHSPDIIIDEFGIHSAQKQ